MSLLNSQNGIRHVSALNGGTPLVAREVATPAIPPTADLAARAQAVAEIAAKHAPAVDRAARFPEEAIQAAREQRLLGILVPTELGGEGASISDAVDVCYTLGRACGSTGLIFAMHQMMVACLIRHGIDSAWHHRLIQRIHSAQLLLASSTTEGKGGGDLRKSQCAVEQEGAAIALTKSATVMSYGAQADAIVTTARRSADAPATDQVLVAFCKGDYRLEHIVGWDTLGMRGTCSAGFNFEGYRKDRAGAAGTLPENPRAHRHARRASDMERGLDRESPPAPSTARARSSAAQRAAATARLPPGAAASHAGDRVIADPARGDQIAR